jgi:transposase
VDGQRRLVGIDLGIASAHTVRVLDGGGREVCRRRCEPTVASLTVIEQAALAGAPDGTRLEVVIEPTGPAWLPIAVFFTERGHTVFRVSSQKAADLRRFLSRHAKSNGIDAATLARLPLVDPDGLAPLQLPGAERAALDRRVRACDRLTMQAAEHKVRLKDLVRQLMPLTPLTGDLGRADLAVLERWADPQALLRLGQTRLTTVIAKASNNHQGAARAAQWLASAAAAVELYGEHPAVAFADLAAEVATEVRLIRAIEAELAVHAPERELAYRWADPGQLARSLPGLAEVGGPSWPRSSARRPASLPVPTSSPTWAWPPRRRRPARPTARASRCPRPAPGCCGPRWSAPPTTPASRTPSWPRCTTSRWSNGARSTSRPSASSPAGWPSAAGRSCTGACRTWFATPPANPLHRPKPR